MASIQAAVFDALYLGQKHGLHPDKNIILAVRQLGIDPIGYLMRLHSGSSRTRVDLLVVFVAARGSWIVTLVSVAACPTAQQCWYITAASAPYRLAFQRGQGLQFDGITSVSTDTLLINFPVYASVKAATGSLKMELPDSSINFLASKLGVQLNKTLFPLLCEPEKCARQLEAEGKVKFDLDGYISSDEAWDNRDSLNSWCVSEVRHSVSHVTTPTQYWHWNSNGRFKDAIWGVSPNFILQLAAITTVTYDSESSKVIIGIKNICRTELEDFMRDIFGIAKEDIVVNFKRNRTKVRFLEFLRSKGVELSEATEADVENAWKDVATRIVSSGEGRHSHPKTDEPAFA